MCVLALHVVATLVLTADSAQSATPHGLLFLENFEARVRDVADGAPQEMSCANITDDGRCADLDALGFDLSPFLFGSPENTALRGRGEGAALSYCLTSTIRQRTPAATYAQFEMQVQRAVAGAYASLHLFGECERTDNHRVRAISATAEPVLAVDVFPTTDHLHVRVALATVDSATNARTPKTARFTIADRDTYGRGVARLVTVAVQPPDQLLLYLDGTLQKDVSLLASDAFKPPIHPSIVPDPWDRQPRGWDELVHGVWKPRFMTNPHAEPRNPAHLGDVDGMQVYVSDGTVLDELLLADSLEAAASVWDAFHERQEVAAALSERFVTPTQAQEACESHDNEVSRLKTTIEQLRAELRDASPPTGAAFESSNESQNGTGPQCAKA